MSTADKLRGFNALAAIEQAIRETEPRKRIAFRDVSDAIYRIVNVLPPGSLDYATAAAVTAAIPGALLKPPHSPPSEDCPGLMIDLCKTPDGVSGRMVFHTMIKCAQRHGWTIDEQSASEAWLSKPA